MKVMKITTLQSGWTTMICLLSDNKHEIKDEVNYEFDGNVKYAKDVRGYYEGLQQHESN